MSSENNKDNIDKEKETVIKPTEEKEKKTKDETKKNVSEAADNKSDAASESEEIEDKDLTEIKLDKVLPTSSQPKNVARQQKKKLSKKAQKLIKVLVIIAVIIAAIVIYVQYAAYKVFYESDLFTTTTEEAVVERQNLMNTISTTGTIQSKDVRTITSALSGVTIDEVNCEVGDMVEEGQLLVAFSRDDINEKITQIEEDISKNKATQALTEEYKAKEHAYDYGTAAYDNYTAAANTVSASTSLARAQEDLDQACRDRSKFMDDYNEAVANKDRLQAKLDEANAMFALFKATNNIPKTVDDPTEDWYFLNTDNVDKDGVIDFMGYQYTVAEFQNYITDLSTKVKEYETTINSYDTSIDSYDKKISTAERALQDAQTKLGVTQASQGETVRKTTNNLVTSDYNYAKDALTAGDNVTSLERQLNEQTDKLDDFKVTAPIAGMVTTVNAQEGNGYSSQSGALLVVQAVDTFEVTTQIDEYDINRVAVGQKVAIMTDATGDDTLDGEVSFIAPTTTVVQNAASNTYEVKINVLTKDDRLKLGMSAKLNIITESHDNVLAVRYDAIEEKDTGELVVYVLDDAEVSQQEDATEDASEQGGILVVKEDGTAKISGTPTPAAADKTDKKATNDKKSKKKKDQKDEKPSFIKYLFSSKDDLDAVVGLDDKKGAREVIVTKGIEGDYYTEIQSPEIKEGMVVMVNSKTGAMQNVFMQMMNGDFSGDSNMGGGPGGPGGF